VLHEIEVILVGGILRKVVGADEWRQRGRIDIRCITIVRHRYSGWERWGCDRQPRCKITKQIAQLRLLLLQNDQW
jgi:hypothetical protein